MDTQTNIDARIATALAMIAYCMKHGFCPTKHIHALDKLEQLKGA